ncbi:hypothetical protein [Flavobacterium hungaricum]|uniref:DUF3899 domain-containing protein n=1 Tax=Flavobacterium hungaricum TaxID=2082725 RepID=A0ABR9TQF8_9FLAO|nr:hypothetical protein [Flavobacterium hungaricum]MBE8726847.1 hypothetical protein [Flavobacterium hungaricum]
MRTLRTKYLSEIPIQEDNYKVDFIILEKYQNFSSEILRLSLLGLTIYGFLIANVIVKISECEKLNNFLGALSIYKSLLFAGAVFLILGAFFALGHRYFSTDCMTHFIRGFRLRQRLKELKNQDKDEYSEIIRIKESIKNEEISFENDLNICKWFLLLAGFFLILGILLATIAFACSFNNILN